MLHFKHLTITSLSGVLLSLIANPAWAALSIAEVNSIARQTTVLIAPGLTPELKAVVRHLY